MVRCLITRSKLGRSPLATGPGFAWKWLYTCVAFGPSFPQGIELIRGAETLASVRSYVNRKVKSNGWGPFYIDLEWKPVGPPFVPCGGNRA